MKILNLGSMNIDNVYRVDEFIAPGETKLSASLTLFCGGKGLNQSIAAARAGNEVWHAGLVGEDGAMLLKRLEADGVNTSLIFPAPGRCGHAIIQVNDRGQNCILLYGGTNRSLTESDIDRIFDQFGNGDGVLLQNEVNLLPYIVQQAARRGLPVFFNAAPMDEQALRCPLECIRWLIVNEIEGRQLAGCENDDEIIPALARKAPDCSVLLTLGSRGAVCRTPEQTVRVEALHVPVVDTTAAGDTFTGFFLYGVLAGLPLPDVLIRATAASAVCVGRPGAADSVPRRAEVEQLLDSGQLPTPRVELLT